MTIQEFYETVRDNYLQDLDFFRVKKDSSGEKYISTPIISKENLIDRIENEINDPWEDIEDCSEEEETRLLEEVKADILAEYERVLSSRKEFMEKLHPEEEYQELFED